VSVDAAIAAQTRWHLSRNDLARDDVSMNKKAVADHPKVKAARQLEDSQVIGLRNGSLASREPSSKLGFYLAPAAIAHAISRRPEGDEIERAQNQPKAIQAYRGVTTLKAKWDPDES
jgi:hypothetical protein